MPHEIWQLRVNLKVFFNPWNNLRHSLVNIILEVNYLNLLSQNTPNTLTLTFQKYGLPFHLFKISRDMKNFLQNFVFNPINGNLDEILNISDNTKRTKKKATFWLFVIYEKLVQTNIFRYSDNQWLGIIGDSISV